MRLLAQDLACIRGGRQIFDKVSFEIASGSSLSITGRNGSGKSSLLRVVAGLVPRSGGILSLTGGGPEATLPEQLHYCGHLEALKPALTALENLAFWRRYLGSPALEPLGAMERLSIAHLRDLPASYLSAGQKRRLALARLLVSRRPIWLLDEPNAALDAASQDTLGVLCEEHLAQGGLILAATHGDLGFAPTATLEMAA
jgi:heme exporter protein A